MIIKARHIPFFVNFFNIYTRLNIRNHFSSIKIVNHIPPPSLPVLLIGNHSTWWDGFFAVYLNLKIFKKKIHVMMLEEQLTHRMFLNKAGAFSIKKGDRSMAETFQYSKEILKNNANLLLLFPQGEIQSSYTFPLKFEKGILNIFKNVKKPFQLVFYAALIDYFSTKKPQLNFYLRNYNFESINTIADLEKAYNAFLKECMLSQKE